MLWCFAVLGAWATTLAVFPLDGGGDVAAWDGLGTALSGMLTTDLSDVEGVRLVERTRIDAVLGEIDLGERGFVVSEGAARLGKGLGADFLVVGGFAVIGGTFAMDARLVDAATGEVRGATRAEGAQAEWVAVEKSLVAGLLDELDIALADDARSRMVRQAPTQDLSALAAYGRGEALAAEGRLEDARRAFEAALAFDPSFAMARTAMSRLGAALDAERRRRIGEASDARARRIAAALAAIPDERLRDAAFRDRPDDVARFAVRLYALHLAELDCDAYAEMRHYLARRDWAVEYPKGGYADLRRRADLAAVEAGLVEAGDAAAQRDLSFQLAVGPVTQMGSLSRFVALYPTPVLEVPRSVDLLHSGLRCHGPVAFVDELEALRVEATQRGLDRVPYGPDAPLTLGERLEIAAIELRSRNSGLSDGDAARMVALLEAQTDPDTRYQVEVAGRAVTSAARSHDLGVLRWVGLEPPTVQGAVLALSEGDRAWFDVERPGCAEAVSGLQAPAAHWVTAVAGAPDAQRESRWAWHAPVVRALADLGCVRGFSARFDTPPAAVAWVLTAEERVRPDADPSCLSRKGWRPSVGSPDDLTWSDGLRALVDYYPLVSGGCVADPVADPRAGTPR